MASVAGAVASVLAHHDGVCTGEEPVSYAPGDMVYQTVRRARLPSLGWPAHLSHPLVRFRLGKQAIQGRDQAGQRPT